MHTTTDGECLNPLQILGRGNPTTSRSRCRGSLNPLQILGRGNRLQTPKGAADVLIPFRFWVGEIIDMHRSGTRMSLNPLQILGRGNIFGSIFKGSKVLIPFRFWVGEIPGREARANASENAPFTDNFTKRADLGVRSPERGPEWAKSLCESTCCHISCRDTHALASCPVFANRCGADVGRSQSRPQQNLWRRHGWRRAPRLSFLRRSLASMFTSLGIHNTMASAAADFSFADQSLAAAASSASIRARQ